MKEISIYRKIRKNMKCMKKVVLHCHGLPGSGKSQIVRKLAAEFPFSQKTNEIVLKLQIKCQDCRDNVKEELQNVTNQLERKNFITENDKEDLKKCLANDSTDNFVDILLNQKFPVLIVVENPELNTSKALLQDFVRKLSANSYENKGEPNLHLYIASRTESSVLRKDERIKSSIYVKKRIRGFNKSESLEYLELNSEMSDQDENERILIFKRFGGLPQGLQTAKNFCLDHNKRYSDYLNMINKFEYRIFEAEKNDIKSEFGESAEHLFQAMVFSIVALDKLDQPDLKYPRLKILSCLSYLHFDRIPWSTLELCYKILCKRKLKNKKTDFNTTVFVGKLITCLCDRDMCSKMKNNDNELAFNDVLMTALRLHHFLPSNSVFNPLENAVKVLHKIVTKNLFEESLLKLHVETLLGHVEKESSLFKNKEDIKMVEDLKAVISAKKVVEVKIQSYFVFQMFLVICAVWLFFAVAFYFFIKFLARLV